MRTKLNKFFWYSNPRAEGEVMRACACVWLGKRRLAAESCWYPVLALAQTLPHTTRALPSTLTYFLILHHTFLYLILLTHDYRSSPCYLLLTNCYLLLTHVGELTSFVRDAHPFFYCAGQILRGRGVWILGLSQRSVVINYNVSTQRVRPLGTDYLVRAQ